MSLPALEHVSLVSYLDKRVSVVQTDERILLGILRTFDQFVNVFIEGASERITVGDLCSDVPLGHYVVRGETVAVIGELDPEKQELPVHMTRVSVSEIKVAQKAETDTLELKRSMRQRMAFLDLD